MAFRLKTYLKSGEAERKGIDNTPGVDSDGVGGQILTSEIIIGNIENLHNKMVDPIMRHFNNLPGSSGNSIGITSGYRCKKLNESIKPPGAKNSQHIHGCAVDIIYTEGETSEIFNWAVNNLPTYDQIIWEFPEKGRFTVNDPNLPNNFNPSWIHLSYVEGRNRKTTSLATNRDDLHSAVKTDSTIRRGIYTHGITEADQTLV